MVLTNWIRLLRNRLAYHHWVKRIGYRGRSRHRRPLRLHSTVDVLENRTLLSANPVIDAGAAAGDGTADSFSVSSDGITVTVSVNGTTVLSDLASNLTSITLSGSSDDDSFAINFTNGLPQLTITGGDGTDNVNLTGDNQAGPTGGALSISVDEVDLLGDIKVASAHILAADILLSSSRSLTTTAADVTLESTGALTIYGTIDAGDGKIRISANNDGVGSESLVLGTGAVLATTSTAADAILLQANASGGTSKLRVAGTWTTGDGGGITVSTGNPDQTAAANIELQTIHYDVGATGTVQVLSDDGLVLMSGHTLDLSQSGQLTLSANLDGVGSDALIIQGTILSPGADDVVLESPGRIYVYGTIDAGDGRIRISANNDGSGSDHLIVEFATNAVLTTTSSAADAIVLEVNANGGTANLTVGGTWTTGDGGGILVTTGSPDQSAAVRLTMKTVTYNVGATGSIHFHSDDILELASGHTLDLSQSGLVTFSANQDGTDDDALVIQGTILSPGEGDVILESPGAIYIYGAIDAGDGKIRLSANNDGIGAGALILRNGAVLTTTSSAADAIVLEVNANGGTGNVIAGGTWTTGDGGGITVSTGNPDQTAAVSLTVESTTYDVGPGGSIQFLAEDGLTIASNKTITAANGGTLSLRADADADGTGNLTLSSAALIAHASADGPVVLHGANFIINPTATVALGSNDIEFVGSVAGAEYAIGAMATGADVALTEDELATITTTGTVIVSAANSAGNDVFHVDTATANTLTIRGQDGADQFNITPNATGVMILVEGGDPTTFPGDVLNFTSPPSEASTVTPPDLPNGTITTTGGFGDVVYTGIEELDGVGVGDPPVVTPNPLGFSISEDAAASAEVGVISAADADGDPLTNWTITAGNSGDAFTIAPHPTNPLAAVITVAAGLDRETTSSYTLSVTVDDVNGNTSLPVDFVVTILDVNDNAPTTQNKTITTDEDVGYTFSTSDFAFDDVDSTSALGHVEILSLPNFGSFTLNGSPVTVSTPVTSAQLAAGELEFVPDADLSGTAVTSFTFAVSDGAFTSTAASLSIDVTAVNDAPTIQSPMSFTTAANEALVLSGISIADNDADDDAPNNLVKLTLAVPVSNSLTVAVVSGGVPSTGVTGDSTNVVVLEGTLAQINATLADASGVTLTPEVDFDGSFNLDLTLTDQGHSGVDPLTIGQPNTGDGTFEEAIATILIQVNSGPVVDLNGPDPDIGRDFLTSYTENSTGVLIADSDTVITYDGGTSISEIEVTFTSSVSGDELFVDPSALSALNITVAPSSGVGTTLTLTSGTATFADYENALKLIRFRHIGEDPGDLQRVISITAKDGATVGASSFSQIDVVPVNNAPMLDLDDGSAGDDYTGSYTEDSPAIPIAADMGVVITDVDDTTLQRATITIISAQAGDLLSSVPGGLPAGIQIDTANSTDTTLILIGQASPEAYGTALEAVRFENTSQMPNTTVQRDITVVVQDPSGGDSNVAHSYIDVIALNDPPVANNDNGTVKEDDLNQQSATGNVLANDTDPDNDPLTVTHVDGTPVNTAPTNIPGTYGSLDINPDGTFTYTLDNAKAAVNQLDDGETLQDVFTYTIQDAVDVTATATLSITIDGTNDAPTLDLDVSNNTATGNDYEGTFSEGDNPIPITDLGDTSVVDPEETLASAAVSLTNPTTDDVLTVDPTLLPATITASLASGTEITLTGSSATASDFLAALELIRFDNTSQNPDTTQRVIEVQLTDARGATSPVALSRINVVRVTDAPTLDLDANDSSGAATGADGYLGTFEEDAGPVPIADDAEMDVVIADVDDIHIESAMAILTNAMPGDVLFFDVAAYSGPALTVESANGTLTLSGSATLDDYEDAIGAIRFDNTLTNPDTTDRIINVTVSDGDQSSNTAISTIQVVDVNNTAPTINIPSSIEIEENSAVFTSGNSFVQLSVTDPDGQPSPPVFDWQLTNDPLGLFTLVPESNDVSLAKLEINTANLAFLDFETMLAGLPGMSGVLVELVPGSGEYYYRVTVTVEDDVQQANSTSEDVYIRVLNLAEGPVAGVWHHDGTQLRPIAAGSTYDVGSVTPGVWTLPGTYYLINQGDVDLLEAGEAIDSPFDFSGAPTYVSLVPGQFEGFMVSLDTTTNSGVVTGDVTLSFAQPNDPGDFVFTLQATIIETAADMEVYVDGVPLADNAVIDFGTSLLNQPISRQVTIFNTGNDTLTIDPVADPDGFDWSDNNQLTINAGASATFDITMLAATAGTHVEQLTLPVSGAVGFTLNLFGTVNDPASTSNQVQIIDNGDAGFSQSGQWETKNNAGFDGDVQVSDDGGAATWTFSGLDAGLYYLSTTWDRNAGDYTTSSEIFGFAPFTISDGTGDLDTVLLNQHRYYGNPTTFSEWVDVGGTETLVTWEELGAYFLDPATPGSGTLAVTLNTTDSSINNRVVADAVRLERLQPADDMVIMSASQPSVTIDVLDNDRFPTAVNGDPTAWQVELVTSDPSIRLNLDGTVTYTSSGSSTFEFEYNLTDGTHVTSSATVSIVRTLDAPIYRDDEFSTSQSRPVTFDARRNDVLSNSSSTEPTFLSVKDGTLQTGAGSNQWNVIDNGIYWLGPTTSLQLTLTIDGNDYSASDWGNETDLADQLNNNLGPDGYWARAVDISHLLPTEQTLGSNPKGLYVQVFGLSPSDTLTASSTTSGATIHDSTRGTLSTNADGTATYTPNVAFFNVFGDYREEFHYAYSTSDPQTAPGATAVVNVRNTTPHVTVSTSIQVRPDGETRWVPVNAVDPDHKGDDSDFLTIHTLGSTTNLASIFGSQNVTRGFDVAISSTSSNLDDTITVIFSDGYSYSTPQEIRFVNEDSSSIAINRIPYFDFLDPAILPSFNVPFTVSANTTRSTLEETHRESVGDALVDLHDGGLHLNQFFDTDLGPHDLGGFGLTYSSDSASVLPTIQGSLFRINEQITTPPALGSLKVQLSWHKLKSDGGTPHIDPHALVTERTFMVDELANEGDDEFHFAIQSPAFPTEREDGTSDYGSGIYRWTLLVTPLDENGSTIGSESILMRGDELIIRNQHADATANPFAGFGDGWALAGMPRLIVELNREDPDLSPSDYQPWQDDRVILTLPDGGARLFVPGGGSSDGQERVWIPVEAADRSHIRRELGELTRTAGGWQYIAEDRTIFHFNQDGNLVEIEPVVGPSTTFSYVTTQNNRTLIQSITASDGAVTTFVYDSNTDLLDRIQLPSEAGILRELDVTVNLVGNSTLLSEMKLLDLAASETLWTRTFGQTQITEIELERMDQGTASFSISGTTNSGLSINNTITLALSDLETNGQSDPAKLQAALIAANAALAGVTVEIPSSAMDNNSERFNDPDPPAEKQKIIRLVFSGIDLAGQQFTVTPVSRSQIHATSFVVSSDTWGNDPAYPDQQTTFVYDRHGMVSEVNFFGDVYLVSTPASHVWETVSTRQPVATLTIPTTDLQKLDAGSAADFDQLQINEYKLDNRGRLLERLVTFQDSVGGVTTLTEENWIRDHFGNVIEYTEDVEVDVSAGTRTTRTTQFSYDYSDAPRRFYEGDLNPLLTALWTDNANNGLPVLVVQPDNHHGRITDVFLNYTHSSTEYETKFGLPIRQSDALGRETLFVRDSSTGLVTTIVGPENLYETFTYSQAAGEEGLVETSTQLVSVDDLDSSLSLDAIATLPNADFLKSEFIYDNNRRIFQVLNNDVRSDGQGGRSTIDTRTRTYEYDNFGYLNFVVDDNGNEFQTTYDAAGRLSLDEVRWWDNDAATHRVLSSNTFTYEDNGALSSVTDGRGVTTEYEYYANGLLALVTEAVGETDASGASIEQETLYQYYANGSLKEILHPDSQLSEFYYDPLAFTTWTRSDEIYTDSQTDPSDTYETIEAVTDALGRVVTTNNLLTGENTRTKYDPYDRIIESSITVRLSESTPDELLSRFHYDGVGNLIREDAPRVVTRDVDGNIASEEDPVQTSVLSFYDSRNRLTRTKVLSPDGTDEHGAIVDTQYDPGGRLRKTVEIRFTPVFSPTNPASIDTYAVSTPTTEYEYNAFGDLVKLTVPAEAGHQISTFEYDVIGNLESEVDRFGNETDYVLDAFGRIVEQTNPDGSTLSLKYDEAGNLIDQLLEFDPANQTATSFRRTYTEYDALNRPIIVGRAATREGDPEDPDNDGDPADLIVGFLYEVGGTPFGINSVSTTNQTTRGVEPNVVLPTLPATTVYTDGRGQTVRIERPDPGSGADANADFWDDGPNAQPDHPRPVTSFEYAYAPASGTIVATTIDPLGRRSPTTTNVLGWTLSTSEPGTEVAKSGITYDAAGRVVKQINLQRDVENDTPVTHPRQTTYAYDPVTGLVAVQRDAASLADFPNNDGPATSYIYDSAGNLIRRVDPLENFTESTYDGLNRVMSEKVNLVTVLNSDTRQWSYNGLTSTYSDRDGRIIRTSVDPASNTLTESWFAVGADPDVDTSLRTITSVFNPAGAVVSIDDNGETTSDFEFTYDVFGRSTRMWQDSGFFGTALPTARFERGYTSTVLHPTTGDIVGSQAVVGLHLDTTPDRNDQDDLDFSVTTFDLDNLGRLWGVKQDLATGSAALWANGSVGSDKHARVKYNIDSRPSELVRQSDLDYTEGTGANLRGITSFDYRPADGKIEAISSKTDRSPQTLSIATYGYTYDGMTAIPESFESIFFDSAGTNLLNEQRTFHTDPLGRLGDVDLLLPVDPQAEGDYTYDAAGNRDTAQSGDPLTFIGPPNRLVHGPKYTYVYDDEGHVTQRTLRTLNPGVSVNSETYTWDHRGRLTMVEQFGDVGQPRGTIEYAYDALNRLIGRKVTPNGSSAETSGFVYDGGQRLLEMDLTGGTTNAGVLRSNFYGPLGELNAVDVADGQAPTGTTETVWTFSDPAGTPRSLARYNSSTEDWTFLHRQTNEFGSLYLTHGDAGSDTDPWLTAVPLYVSGFEQDAATGLYLAGSRWYDATAGRFLEPGSGQGDGGGYAFVPVNPMDLANGYIGGGARSDSPQPSMAGAFVEGLLDGYANIGGAIRSVGDFLATPYDYVANSTDSPFISTFAGFESGLIQLPFDVVGGLVDVRGFAGGLSQRASAFYNAAGGGFAGVGTSLYGTLGLLTPFELYYGSDILTGEELAGDAFVDKAIEAGGAIGSLFLPVGLAARSAQASRLAIAAQEARFGPLATIGRGYGLAAEAAFATPSTALRGGAFAALTTFIRRQRNAPTTRLPDLPEGYHYRNVGGRIDVARNPSRAADLPPLHLENGQLVRGLRPSIARDSAARTAFLRGLADNPNVPKSMRPWLSRGEVPPGYVVHHKKALFDGGADTIDNMVLQAVDLHKGTHRYYRPGGQVPSINPRPGTFNPY